MLLQAGVPEKQHDSVVLRYCLDLDDQKAADFLGTPVSALRSNLRHDRRRLACAIGRQLWRPAGR
ncbi:hypothetical protein [Kitasatospora sp. NPDC127116]|uniref:hypothetical protein n=1 Tax=Kitasatospora sp. NPDC127116 TaxID=3345367 RepID=UPI0036324BE4